MSTYKLTEIGPGNWAIERFVDGTSQGFTHGRYEDKASASFVATVYVRMEMREATR
jgi:hypothetical protein